MERKLRLGVAGLGRAFTVMLPTLPPIRASRLVAAADTRAEARKRFAGGIFRQNAYDRSTALCADPAVEASMSRRRINIIASTRRWRPKHGKHVLIEKPMALTLEECAVDDRRGAARRRACGRRPQPHFRCARSCARASSSRAARSAQCA